MEANKQNSANNVLLLFMKLDVANANHIFNAKCFQTLN